MSGELESLLAGTHIAQSQTQKEATANAAFDRLAGAANAVRAITGAGGVTVVSADDFGKYGAIRVTGSVTGSPPMTLSVPNVARVFGFVNDMSDGNVIVTNGDAQTAVIPDGYSATLLSLPGVGLIVLAERTTGGGGGGSSLVFKYTRLNRQGNITGSGTSFAVIDNTKLPALSLDCAAGDIVELELQAQVYASGTNAFCFDWQVVQPALGTRRVSPQPNDSGVAFASGGNRQSPSIRAIWVCAEAGTHTFQPMWRSTGGDTLTMTNATSGADDSAILHVVTNLGAAA